MNESVELSVEEGRDLALAAMLRYGFGVPEATVTVDALLGAERDGLPSHGLARLPYYLDQAACGKVKVAAVPRLEMEGAVVRVDAGYGLAFPAVAKGLTAGLDCAARLGIAAVAIARSHHFGAAGAPVEHAARQGYLALAFSNAPSAIAPWGGGGRCTVPTPSPSPVRGDRPIRC